MLLFVLRSQKPHNCIFMDGICRNANKEIHVAKKSRLNNACFFRNGKDSQLCSRIKQHRSCSPESLPARLKQLRFNLSVAGGGKGCVLDVL